MFQISALPASQFEHLYGRSDDDLRAAGVVTMIADSKPGYPCRVSLRDAEPGTRMLLMNFEHQDAATPFRSRHAIFVADGASPAAVAPGEVPDQLRSRLLSVRAFSADGMMTDADVTEGAGAAEVFQRLLRDGRVAYLHVHYARRGCFAARVDRA